MKIYYKNFQSHIVLNRLSIGGNLTVPSVVDWLNKWKCTPRPEYSVDVRRNEINLHVLMWKGAHWAWISCRIKWFSPCECWCKHRMCLGPCTTSLIAGSYPREVEHRRVLNTVFWTIWLIYSKHVWIQWYATENFSNLGTLANQRQSEISLGLVNSQLGIQGSGVEGFNIVFLQRCLIIHLQDCFLIQTSCNNFR